MTIRLAPPWRSRARIVVSVAAMVLAAGSCGATPERAVVTRAEPRSATSDGAEATTPSSRVVTAAPTDGTLVLDTDGTDPDLPGTILVVGDSVLVLIADDLAARLDTRLVVDGADCRRIDTDVAGPCGGVPAGARVASGVDTIADDVAALRADGTPPTAGIVVLANNSALSADDLDLAMDAFGAVDHVWWVNARIEGFGRQDPNNRALDALARRNPRAIVVDWFTASANQPWRKDHVHPNTIGQAALASLVARAVSCGCPT